jgi:AICAR transformylase/IMP cyclohydrolase PurH
MDRAAFLSVHHKDKYLVSFANELRSIGFDLYATPETWEYLENRGVGVVNIDTHIQEAKSMLAHLRRFHTASILGAGLRAAPTENGNALLTHYGAPRIEVACIDIGTQIKPIYKVINTVALTIENGVSARTLLNAAKAGDRYFVCQQRERNDILRALASGDPFTEMRVKQALFNIAARLLGPVHKELRPMPLFGIDSPPSIPSDLR